MIPAGKGTYSVGWATVAGGVALLAVDVGQMLAVPEATCTTILAPLLTSQGFLMILGGLGINTGRRAYANATKRAEAKQDDLINMQQDAMKKAMRELLSETKQEPTT